MVSPESKQIVLVVTGRDAPGITSSLTNILNRDGLRLLDIEQAVTHNLLSLSMVIEFVGNEGGDKAVLKDLLFKAKELGISLDFFVVDGELALRSSEQQFVVTLMSDDLHARHIAAIAAVLAKRKVNIDSIRKLNEGGLFCLELITYTNSKIDQNGLKDDLLKVASRFSGLDIAVQRESVFRRSKRLVVMDMDSTLIQIEVIDELAKIAGRGKEVAQITEKAMAGEIDYDESLRQRVSLLKGLSEKEMKQLADQIPLTEGAEVLIKTLKRLGFKIGLITGGFSFFGEKFKKKLELDYVYSNVLEIENGKLTGKVKGPIINAVGKAELLEKIARLEGIPLESVVAIGDGANDILMLQKAGLGIAFNAKKKAQKAAAAAINQKTLASILYLLGITDKDIEEVSRQAT